jgi:hypothetical protein
MNASSHLKARLVRVKIDEGRTGLFYATSPDLKGLLVAEPTLDALDEAVRQAIVDLYEVCGAKVVATKLEDNDDELHPWVAIPAEVAQKAVSAR